MLTPDGVLDGGRVTLEGDQVAGVASGDGAVDVDARGGWIVPGFIDVQINGAHGVDVTTEPERIDELGAALVRYGVTAFVPTVITCAEPVRRAALAAWTARDAAGVTWVPCRSACTWRGRCCRRVRKGAHPADLLAAPSAELIDGWSADAGVVLATVAPELPGADDVIAELVAARRRRVDRPHRWQRRRHLRRLRRGARYVTHLFNAMRPFSHRDPGPIGAALADDEVVVGLICDGVHVDPVAVRMAARALGPGRLSLVTDAISALGVEAGRLGSVDVTVGADGVRNADGVLAGSVLTLDQAVRNLIAFTGWDVPAAIATVTSTPADLLGLADRGRLVAGMRADVTVLDSDLACHRHDRRRRGRMEVVIVPTADDAAGIVAGVIAGVLGAVDAPVIGLSTGSSPLGAYALLVEEHRQGRVSFARASAVLLDEYVGLPADHPDAYRSFIRRELTDQVDLPPDRLFGPEVWADDIAGASARGTSSCSPSSAGSMCSCWASGRTVTSASTSRARRWFRGRGSRHSPRRRCGTTPGSSRRPTTYPVTS